MKLKMEHLPLYVGLGVTALAVALAARARLASGPGLPTLSAADRARLLGVPSWEPAPTAAEPGAVKLEPAWSAKNLVLIEIPELAELATARGWSDWKSGKVMAHRAVADDLRALWADWKKEGLLDRILSVDGFWASRLTRGSTSSLSNHAYGSAFDVNAAQNPLGKAGAGPGERGSTHELEEVAWRHGFTTGRRWARPDAMHFEYAKRA